MGCGEADGVAVGVAAVGDVDELVAQPQAEAGTWTGAVQGAGWEESDKRVSGAGPAVGHGDGDPVGLRPQPQQRRWPSVHQGVGDGFVGGEHQVVNLAGGQPVVGRPR